MSASEHMASKLQSRPLRSNGSTSPRLSTAGSRGRAQREPAEASEGEDVRSLRAENEELRQENQRLRAALAAKDPPQGIGESVDAGAATCSESRLRSVLADYTATGEQLRQAIAGAEALIEEARRELAAKDLRAKRAAYEQLHSAANSLDETLVAVAVTNARFAQVDEADIQLVEKKLADLKSMTPEEREAKFAQEKLALKKKEVFLLVKRDDAAALQALLDELEEGTRWQDWRDYQGRTLRRFAQDLRAARCLEVLGVRLGFQVAPQTARGKRASAPASLAVAAVPPPSSAAAAVQEQVPDPAEGNFPAGPSLADGSQDKQPNQTVKSTQRTGLHQSDESNLAGHIPAVEEDAVSSLSAEDEEQLKIRALKAVAQDDCVSLLEVLKLAPKRTMAGWQNKAGKDLLTLSEERGSSCAYTVLAKALGIVREMKRETYEEREAVWVFVHGDVQPRRATVLEDTPEEADAVLLEFWDSTDPPEHVERCLVRRMWS